MEFVFNKVSLEHFWNLHLIKSPLNIFGNLYLIKYPLNIFWNLYLVKLSLEHRTHHLGFFVIFPTAGITVDLVPDAEPVTTLGFITPGRPPREPVTFEDG